MSQPAAGWYADPAGGPAQRYWDGTAWTEHLAPAPASPTPGYPAGYPGGALAVPGPGMVQPYRVEPKSVPLCMVISFFLPGVGSMVAGNTRTGVIILVGWLVSCVLTLVLIGLVGVIGFFVWGLVDAYQSATRWNLQHGIVS